MSDDNQAVPFWKQPLFHFLLIGALIFAWSSWRGDEPQVLNDQIVVSVSDVERMAYQWQRSPSEAELQALVRDHIKEEVYYREALSLGLDINDPIIRKRLRQKMEFLVSDKADLIEPSADQLSNFFKQKKEQYKRKPTFDLQQIYFSEDSDINFEQLLIELKNGKENKTLGDSIDLPKQMTAVNENYIKRIFGTEFNTQLETLVSDQWHGPIQSGFGSHLVLIENKQEVNNVVLDDVKQKVLRDWRLQQRKELDTNAYNILREKYKVKIEIEDYPE